TVAGGRSFSFVPVGPQAPEEPGERHEHEHDLTEVIQRHVHLESPLSEGRWPRPAKRISYSPEGGRPLRFFVEGGPLGPLLQPRTRLMWQAPAGSPLRVYCNRKRR